MTRLNRRGFLRAIALAGLAEDFPLRSALAVSREADRPAAHPADASDDASVDALSLGMKPDGVTDNMPLLRTAVARAVAAGRASLFVPPGTYSFLAQPARERRVTLPPRFKLWSRPGQGCTFQVDPASYGGLGAGQAAGILAVNHGDVVAGIDYDGRKSEVNGGNPTPFGGNFITRASDDVSDVLIRDCVMINNPGGPRYESFTAQTGFLSRRWTFRNVTCSHNNGTGISVNGDMINEYANPGAGLPTDIALIGCVGTDNMWQGLTVYGARNVRVQDCVGLNNGVASVYGGQGLNLEWVSGVKVSGGRYEGNSGPGVGGFGWIEDVVIGGGVTIRNNNLLDQNDHGEIGFKPGYWYDGPKVDGATVKFRGSLQSLTVERDVSVTPKATGSIRNHLYLGPDATSNFVAGTSAASGTYPRLVGTQPRSVLLKARDVADWTVACNCGSGTKQVDMWLPGIKPDVRPQGPDVATPLGRWVPSNMAVAPGPGEGDRPGAVLLTTTATGTFGLLRTRVTDPNRLTAGRRYLAEIRYRNVSGDQHWGFCVRPPGWNANTGALQFDAHLSTLPGDTDGWYTAYLVIRMPDTSDAQAKIYNYGPTAGSRLAVEVDVRPL